MEYLRIKTFGNLDQGSPVDIAPSNNFRDMKNLMAFQDIINSWGQLGIISKTHRRANFGAAKSSAGITRGMKQLPINGTSYPGYLFCVDATSDYSNAVLKILSITANTWATGAVFTADSRHAEMELYGTGNAAKCFIAHPSGAYKYTIASSHIAAWVAKYAATFPPAVKDKGAAGTAITTITLTWNGTATVTSSANCNSQIATGDWIRKSSSSLYWDEVKSVSTDGLTITLMAASSDTGASAAGGAQKAQNAATTVNLSGPFFVLNWKGKMWWFGGRATSYDSYLWWSTDDPENYSGTGAGLLEIFPETGGATGIAMLGDYLFLFKDYAYFVYRWTGDVDLPIEFVRKFNYPSVAHSMICDMGDYLTYFTGNEIRITNGSQDVSLSYPYLKNAIFNNGTWVLWSLMYCYNGDAQDNIYPCILKDDVDSFVYFCFPDNAGGGTAYIYDYQKRKWVGQLYNFDAGTAVIIKRSDSTFPNLVYGASQIDGGDQLEQLVRSVQDYTNNAVLFSLGIDFGMPDKKKKIYWVEFTFHPYELCNTYLGFDWWDFDDVKSKPYTTFALNTNAQTYNLAGVSSQVETRDKKRFSISDAECYTFGFVLFEDNTTPPPGGTGTDGWGIIDITIAYDILDTP